MADREKVVKALKECIFLHEHPDDDAGCLECPYRPDEKGTCPTMIPFLKDVLELLKEQEPKPVKVTKNAYNYEFYHCPNCNRGFELTYYKRPAYCDKCGQAVKWE